MAIFQYWLLWHTYVMAINIVLPITTLQETPAGIDFVDGDVIAEIITILKKEKNEGPLIDSLIKQCRRSSDQRRFANHKLIGGPHGLPIHQEDQEEATESFDDIIYVGSAISDYFKHIIFAHSSVNWH